jgi:hypothetical protein
MKINDAALKPSRRVTALISESLRTTALTILVWIASQLVVRCEQTIPVKVPDFCGFAPFTTDASD